MSQFFVVACALVAPSLILSGCDGDVSMLTTTTSATTSTTTTTTTTKNECDAMSFHRDKRPDAGYSDSNAALQAKSEGDCCQACQDDARCVSWLFFAPLSSCQVILDDAVWAGVLAAQNYSFGAKRLGECQLKGCADCGHNSDDIHDKDLFCSKCGGEDSWNQYPCFLPQACTCGGDPAPWMPKPSGDRLWQEEEDQGQVQLV